MTKLRSIPLLEVDAFRETFGVQLIDSIKLTEQVSDFSARITSPIYAEDKFVLCIQGKCIGKREGDSLGSSVQLDL